MTRTYLTVLEKTKDAWGAFSPDVPGTGGMGDTPEEAISSLREGIGYMLDYCIEKSLPLPKSSDTVNFSEFTPNPVESHYEVVWVTVDLPEVEAAANDQAKQAA